MINKQVVFDDLKSKYSFNAADLTCYKYFEKENTSWLCTPLVIRAEGHSVIQSWCYYINDSKKILTSEVLHWGEGEVKLIKQSLYQKKLESEHKQRTAEIIFKNSNYFNDALFCESLDEILYKYSVESIVQGENYRLRIRKLHSAQISYDFFYQSKMNKVSMNIYSPS